MPWPERILREYSTLAIVGASRDPNKPAHSVPLRMQSAGYRVIPVNPFVDGELFGSPVYPRLSAIPDPVDVVVVFRPAAEAADIATEATQIGAKALWLQQGIVSRDARQIAEAAGLLYVEDRCVAVERALHQIEKKPPPTDSKSP